MCIGIPGQIVELVGSDKQVGRVEIMGHTRTIHLGILTPEEVQIGRWVLINAGLAIRPLEPDEAAQLLQVIKELDELFEATYPTT